MRDNAMHILHIVPNPFYLQRGGILRAAEQIVMAQRSGYSCSVVCYHLGEPFGDVPIRRIVRIPWYRKLTPGATVHRLYLDLLLAATLFSGGERHRPDLIHAHLHEGGFAGLPFSRVKGIPLLLDLEGSLSGELQAYRFPGVRLFRRIERLLNRHADLVVTSSAILRGEVERGGTLRRRVQVLHDAIDTGRFDMHGSKDRVRLERFGIPADAGVIAYLGTLDRLQGIDRLADIAPILQERFPTLRFLIMGGPGEARWKELFHENGVRNCIFTGAVTREEAWDLLVRADAAVSLKRSGSFQANGKLIDYMAAGLPVICYDTPGNMELLGDAGCYAAEGDMNGIVRITVELLEDREKRRSIGAAMRNRAQESFSTDRRAPELLEIYESLITAPGKRGGIR